MVKIVPKGILARNTLWMTLGQGFKLAIQALYFTLMARSLGVNNYGAFVAVVALVGIVFPFGSLGSGNLLLKNVSRDKCLFATYWGTALGITSIVSLILVGIVLAASRFVLPSAIPVRLVLLVAISDLLGFNIVAIAGQAFQAFEQLNWTAAIYVFLSTCRLAAALLLICIHSHSSALQWGYVYFCSTAVVSLSSCWVVVWKLGFPKMNLRRSAAEIREGFYFSVGLSAQTVYNDIDKTMLAQLSTLGATGIYSAAYRLIDVSFAPVLALLYAANPNFFRKGAAGVSSSFSYARPLLKRALGYSSLVCAGILLFAGVVPYILGAQYARTTEALRWLAPLPILKVLHYFLSDTLTGAGYQGLRSAVQTAVALFNVLINLWLIPAYSWRGAAWSSVASDALLASAAGTAVFVLSYRSRQFDRTAPVHNFANDTQLDQRQRIYTSE
jgi:O-antigen/teichoic acid export membrane protein